MKILNNSGDNPQPCLTPTVFKKALHVLRACHTFIVKVLGSYHIFEAQHQIVILNKES